MTNLRRQAFRSLLCSLVFATCTPSAIGGEVADVGIILRGYAGTTLFPTAESFEPYAQDIISHLELLSFGEVTTYAIYDAGIDSSGWEQYQSNAEIEVLQAALAGWPEPKWNWVRNCPPYCVLDYTESDRELIQDLLDWIKANNQPSRNWGSSDLGSAPYPSDPSGNSNYFWLQHEVLRFGASASSGFLANMRLPSGYDPATHDITLIAFSHDGDYNTSGAQLSLKAFGVLAADGSVVNGPAAYFDFSALDLTDPIEYGISIDTGVHESVHAFGMGTHDYDPDGVQPDYSVMAQGGRTDTLPAYNRLYWLNWLTEGTITLDPAQITDLSGALSADSQYLLDIGTGSDGLQRYQELFEGEWIQYRIESPNTVYFEETNANGKLDSDGDGVNNIVDADLPPPSLGAFATLFGTVESFLSVGESTLSATPPQPSARDADIQDEEAAQPIPLLQTFGLWILGALVGVLGLRRLRNQFLL